MTKSIIIILFIVLAILLGCTHKKDVKLDLQDSVLSEITDIKYSLPEIEETFSTLDYQNVIDKYSAAIPGNMSITKFKYFVVFSDLDENTTYSVIDNDIRTTVDGMINAYTSKTPDVVTPIFLFNDFEAYKEFTLQNTDIEEKDLSPYGYYKISQNIIVIRYVSWKGSTKHEVTHRMIRSDFRDIPSWFDEGLSSLNEKSVYKDGKLTGEFSWRIIAIRRAITENRYTGLRKLMESNDDELYGKWTSFYYAQSRYLLMYLQEKGLLENYYKLYKETFETDKTGITQLEKTLGKSIKEIDEDFYEYLVSFKQ